jgi:hypothetical protein
LFAALAHLIEDSDHPIDETMLREVCAEVALADPDPRFRAARLASASVEAYAACVRDEKSPGGDAEILMLATRYSIEIAVCSSASLELERFAAACADEEEQPLCKGTVHLLRTLASFAGLDPAAHLPPRSLGLPAIC